MKAPKFEEAVGALLATIALLVVSFVAIVTLNEIALGALIGVVAAATGFYLRGRVQSGS